MHPLQQHVTSFLDGRTGHLVIWRGLVHTVRAVEHSYMAGGYATMFWCWTWTYETRFAKNTATHPTCLGCMVATWPG